MSTLPESLFSTYKQYKVDTDKLATWLAETARKCGYSSDRLTPAEPQEPKLQEGGPKNPPKDNVRADCDITQGPCSRNATRYVIAIRDFIPMAEHIVAFQSPSVVVPDGVVKIITRTILARRRCAAWFEQQAQGNNLLNCLTSHSFFIEVLEKTRDTLRPRCFKYVKKKMPVSKGHKLTPTRDGAERDQRSFVKPFASLTVEESVEDDSTIPPSGSSQARHEEKTSYVAEYSREGEDLLFGCFCFFEDLNEIRSYLQDVWTRYRDQKLTLVAASLTTNTAYDLVRRTEDDFWRAFPQNHGYVESFVEIFFRLACAARGERLGDVTSSELHESWSDKMFDVASWIFLPAWQALYHGKLGLEPLQAILLTAETPRGDMSHVWTLHDVRISTAPLSWPSERNLRKDSVDFDMSLAARCFAAFSTPLPDQANRLAEDELGKGLRKLQLTGNIPTWLVFALQSFLDIHHILRDEVDRPFIDTKAVCRSIRDKMQFYLDEVPCLPDDTHDTCFRRSMRVYIDVINQLFSHRGGSGIHDDLFALHPLWCGLLEFFLLTQYHYYGIREVDVRGILIATMHLYRAMQTHCINAPVWSDLDVVLGIHGSEVLIANRNTTLQQCRQRLGAAMGVIGLLSEQERNKSGLRLSRSGRKRLGFGSTPVSNIFEPRGIKTDARAVELSLENLELILAAATSRIRCFSKIKQNLDGTPVNRAELVKLSIGKPNVSLFELLTGLENGITEEVPRLCFDYLGLHLRCCDAMEGIKSRITLILDCFLTGGGSSIAHLGHGLVPMEALTIGYHLQNVDQILKKEKKTLPLLLQPLHETVDVLSRLVTSGGDKSRAAGARLALGLNWKGSNSSADMGSAKLASTTVHSHQRVSILSESEKETMKQTVKRVLQDISPVYYQ